MPTELAFALAALALLASARAFVSAVALSEKALSSTAASPVIAMSSASPAH
jgi:hypothetical protein